MNEPYPISYEQQYLQNDDDEDEDLLNDQDQDREIENYLMVQNLEYLDQIQQYEENKNLNGEKIHISQRQNRVDEFEFDMQLIQNRVDYQDFDHNQDNNPGQQNYVDSERSNFTQESCSPPESVRNSSRINQNHKINNGMPLNIDDLQQQLENSQNIQKQTQEDDTNDNQLNNEQFTLNMNQSPSHDSLIYSFQGQMTSNFPSNLKDSSHLRLRETNDNQPLILQNQISSSENQSEAQISKTNVSGSDSNRFNGSFYKFEGPRIDNFERSTIIKFEEFEGTDSQQMESDPYRKFSERISDRIYESTDQLRKSQDGPSNNEDEEDDQQPSENQETDQSPLNKDKVQPLFIITEEENSEILSSNNTYNRIQSFQSNGQDSQNQQQNLLDLQRISQMSNHQQNNVYQKSKSQPIQNHRNSSKGIQRYIAENGNILKTDNTDDLQNNSPHFQDTMGIQQRNHQMSTQNPFGYNQTRLSLESPLLNQMENDQMSQYFQKINNNQGFKNSNNQADFIMSEEDLLSNVDRISKILPTNEISEDELERPHFDNEPHFLQKIKDLRQQVDHLKIENHNKSTLIMIKENQINLFQMKNEQLEERIIELEEQIKNPESFRNKQQQDFGMQTVEEERKKIRSKKKQHSNSIKKTPLKLNQDPLLPDFSLYTGLSKQSSISSNNVFDTPLVRNSYGLAGSPQTTQQLNQPLMNKRNSQSFQTDDQYNNFRLQVVQLKNQLQRSEENNLTLQQKVEKYKHDKRLQKDKIFQICLEKSEISKDLEKALQEQQENFRKIEGMKIDIADSLRQIQVFQLKTHSKNNLIDQEVQVKELITQRNKEIQTEFVYSPKKELVFLQLDDQIYKDSLDKQNEQNYLHNVSSSISTKSLLTNNNNANTITIINNRQQDVSLLVGKAREYEHMSQQLQNEIFEHRRILRENQDKKAKEANQYNELKRKIRKREAKIEKLQNGYGLVSKENQELKQKIGEFQQKVQDMRIRTESKLQEKEFKIISLKNQMKVISQNSFPGPSSGFMTPASLNGYNPSKMYSQNELYSLINQIVQQTFNQQHDALNRRYSQDTSAKFRAKSYDQPFSNGFVSFVDEDCSPINRVDDQRISGNFQQNQFNPTDHLDRNQSFSQGEVNGNFFSGQKDQHSSPLTGLYQPTSVINRSYENYAHPSGILNSQRPTVRNPRQSSEIQQIFNSSLKRITQELESIREFSSSNDKGRSGNNSLGRNGEQSQSQQNRKHYNGRQQLNDNQNSNNEGSLRITSIVQKDNINKQIYQYYRPDNKRLSEEYKKQTLYEDSLQTIQADKETLRNQQAKNYSPNLQQNQVEQRYHDSLETMGDIEMNNPLFRKGSFSMQNTHTFRQNTLQNQNTPQIKQQRKQTTINKDFRSNVFNNTLNLRNQEREQNTSILYDFKPAFENSNFINTSGITNTNLKLTNIQNQPAPKFVSQRQSLENSIKFSNLARMSLQREQGTSQIQHIRLQSNLMSRERTIEDQESIQNSDYTVQQIPSHRRKFKSINETATKNMINRTNQQEQNQKSAVKTQKNRTDTQQIQRTNEFQQIMKQGLSTPQSHINQLKMNSNNSNDQSKSSLSNFSQRLEDLKKKYGRIN